MELAYLDRNVTEGIHDAFSPIAYYGLDAYASGGNRRYPIHIPPDRLRLDILGQQNRPVERVLEDHHAEFPPEICGVHDDIRHWGESVFAADFCLVQVPLYCPR